MTLSRQEAASTHRWVYSLTLGIIIAGLTSTIYAQECVPPEIAKLLPLNSTAEDQFGRSVDFDRDTIIIGAYQDDKNSEDSGSAYIFTRTEESWIFQAKLQPNDATPGDGFGHSVSISGDTIIIGSYRPYINGSYISSAYIFTRTGTQWTQQAKLQPTEKSPFGSFGTPVSIDGDTAIVGDILDNTNGPVSGSAYIFTRKGNIWTQQAKLLPNNGMAFDNFATSVSIDSDTVIIGAVFSGQSGSSYVFTRSKNLWTQQDELTIADGELAGEFGTSVSLSNDTTIIGTQSNTAYIFERTNGVWTQQTKLLPDADSFSTNFGSSVAIDNDTIAINSNQGFYSGSASIFKRSDNKWTLDFELLLDADNFNYRANSSVSISADTVIIGAFQSNATGSASIFDLLCIPCFADINKDGSINIFDVSFFLSAFQAQDPIADFTKDGNYNFFDVSAFLAAFAAGCP